MADGRSAIARVAGWRPGRRSATALIAVAPWVGAAVGAGLTAHESGERAQALVIVGRGVPPARGVDSRADTVRAIVALARTRAVQQAAREEVESLRLHGATSIGKATLSVTPSAHASAGFVRIDASADGSARARALADAVASEAIFAASRIVRGADGSTRLVVGDFEDPAVDWLSPSLDRGARLAIGHGGARFHSGYLRATCRIAGCGPVARVAYLFRRGEPYVGTIWARSRQPGVHVTGVLGIAPGGVARTPPAVLGRDWRRIVVSWVPRRTVVTADVGLVTGERRPVTFDIDGVVVSQAGVTDAPGAITPSESQALRAARYATALPARSIGSSGGSRTLSGALVGGAVGLMAGVAGVAAGLGARRRREQQPD